MTLAFYLYFRIHIIPLELKLMNKTVIAIQQGTKMGYISSTNMGVMTNGQRSYTRYNITHGPKGGQVMELKQLGIIGGFI